MAFKRISRTFSTVGEMQYETIGAILYELAREYGYGCGNVEWKFPYETGFKGRFFYDVSLYWERLFLLVLTYRITNVIINI